MGFLKSVANAFFRKSVSLLAVSYSSINTVSVAFKVVQSLKTTVARPGLHEVCINPMGSSLPIRGRAPFLYLGERYENYIN